METRMDCILMGEFALRRINISKAEEGFFWEDGTMMGLACQADILLKLLASACGFGPFQAAAR